MKVRLAILALFAAVAENPRADETRTLVGEYAADDENGPLEAFGIAFPTGSLTLKAREPEPKTTASSPNIDTGRPGTPTSRSAKEVE